MTEHDWLACVTPYSMLEYLRGKVSERKLRLFAVACCRRVQEFLWTAHSSHAVLVAEKHADQQADIAQLAKARSNVEKSLELYPGEPVYDASYWACGTEIEEDVWLCAQYARNCSTCRKPEPTSDELAAMSAAEEAMQVLLIREIVGNPYQPVTISPAVLAWNDGTVEKIACAIYDERAFDRLPILADALEDAGCENADILRHCREPGEHVRGCWVVDLLLGKT